MALSPLDLLFFLWFFFLIDLPRSVGKLIFLSIHSFLEREKAAPPLPRLSIIIPAHNEEIAIANCIESVLESAYQNMEVIVVDDGSTDRTFEIASRYSKEGKIKLVHRDVASGSKAVAINHGVAFAAGEIIVVQDADTLLERTTLAEIVKQFAEPDVVAVSGNVRVLRGEHGKESGLLVNFQRYEYLVSLESGRRYSAILNMIIIVPGALGAFRKDVATSVGLFDRDTITEDFDLTIKLRKAGGRIRFATKAISWTLCPDTWRGWVRQRMRWTHGQMETLRKHRNVFLKYHFRYPLVMAIYDMAFMDLILLLVRPYWLFMVAMLNPPYAIYIPILLAKVYLLNEVVVILGAGMLSPRREDIRYAYLAPLITFFYRPLYGLVRIRAYARWFAGRKVGW